MSCATPGNTPNSRYSPEKVDENPDEPRKIFSDKMLYHQSDWGSKFYFKIVRENLLYVKNEQLELQAQVKIDYTVTDIRTEEMLDSGRIHLDYLKNKGKRIIEDSLMLNTPQELLAIKIKVIDINRNISEKITYKTNKKLPWSAFNFLVLNENELQYDRRSYCDTVTVRADRLVNRKLYVKAYTQIDFLAPPPFSQKTSLPNLNDPDSIYKVDFGSTGKIRMPTRFEHTYQFTGQKLKHNGFFLIRFSKDFPQLKTIASLVPPMRFITSRKEFEKLSDTTEQRKKFEEFWKEKGGSKEQARTLIKSYYNRVEYANSNFTSFKEGWKTDRGMIYLVFGPPDFVYKNKDSEKWVYSESNNTGLTFRFYDEGNNTFTLIRNTLFKSPWYVAVENWRAGRAYKY